MQPDFAKLKPVLSQPNFNTLKPAVSPMLEEEPSYFKSVGGQFSQAGKDILRDIETGAKSFQENVIEGDDLSVAGALNESSKLLRTGLRTAGTVAKTAIMPITEIPLIKKGIHKIGELIGKVPGATETIKTVADLAEKYPETAKDAEAILNILTLGGGKAIEAPLVAEGKAIGKDALNVTKNLLSPTEEAVQTNIQKLFQKSIKPTAKKTLGQGEKYQNDVISALRTIKSKSDSLNIVDDTGELVTGRTPQTINELAQAVDQTKKTVFEEYDSLAKLANKTGAKIDAKPIADEVAKVAQNRALQITNPEIIKYAENWAERLRTLDVLDTETTQAVIQNLNNNLQAFYKNPTYESASRVAVDAGVANNFRQALDTAIQSATGQEYQVLKNQYGALKAIENDVVRASARDARKNVKGLLDYSDIFTSGQMIAGITSLNPMMFTKGAVERIIKEGIKRLNDPNRAIKNIFTQLGKDTRQEFVPTSAVAKFFKNPKVGLSVEDISKSITSAEKGTIRDFTDFVNGSYKPDAKTLKNLKRDAQEIADKYGFTSATKGDKSLSNQFGEYLDSVGFDRKFKK